VISFIDAKLRQFLATEQLDFLDGHESISAKPLQQLTALSNDISHVERQIGVFIQEQANAPEDVQPFYRAEIDKLQQ
jgi:hypothetical protein